ncbi:MAG: hypothetical protein ACYTFY_07850 [Planctomycetota bacterium]|jgi:hypothetical protein
MADWQVEKGKKMCSPCEHIFEENEKYFSALVEREEHFARDDYCLGCWDGAEKEEFFSFWKTRMPDDNEEPKRRFVDTQVIYMFFTKLEDAESTEKLLFRYLLCLILIRKRFLRLDDFLKEDDGEYLMIWDRKAEKILKIYNPEVTEEHLIEAQKELSCIFDMPFDDDAEEVPAGEDSAEESGDEESAGGSEEESEVSEEENSDEDEDVGEADEEGKSE